MGIPKWLACQFFVGKYTTLFPAFMSKIVFLIRKNVQNGSKTAF